MSKFIRVTPNLAVAPQLSAEDFAAAAAAGFRTIINNRPDGEAPGQISSTAARVAAEAEGLAYVNLPFAGPPTPELITAMAAALAGADRPVLAYCRSGTRSISLWALAAVRSGALGPDDALAAARTAGYDLTGLAPRLAQAARG